jgi:DNA-directed RNA polymerase specialized sigma24 family protein
MNRPETPGRPQAWPQGWLAEHGDALVSFAMLHLHDPHSAEDAVQESLLAAVQAWPEFVVAAACGPG